MSGLDALPAAIRTKATRLLAKPGSDGAEVVSFLLDLLAKTQAGQSADKAEASGEAKGSAGPEGVSTQGGAKEARGEFGPSPSGRAPRGTVETASEATKTSPDAFASKWPISQLLPGRHAVSLCLSPKKLATFHEKTGALSIEGDWATFNVFLLLPLPKRPKPHYNLVVTKLGGQGPFLVLSSPNPPADLVQTLQKRCKYADTSAEVSQAVPAYIGAQEGVLYLLDDFIFFGFRKPLKLVLLAEIESISFTVVTSRTFNVVVKLLDDSQHEFEKIPHEYHALILAYNEKHGVNDESLAEERKAKRQKTGPSALEEALEADKRGGASGDDDDEDDEEDEDFSESE